MEGRSRFRKLVGRDKIPKPDPFKDSNPSIKADSKEVNQSAELAYKYQTGKKQTPNTLSTNRQFNKTEKEDDIGKVWADQARIREEEERLEREYLEAKSKTKVLKKKLKETNLDGDPLSLKGILGPEKYKRIKKYTEVSKKGLRTTVNKTKVYSRSVIKKARKKPQYAAIVGVFVIGFLGIVIYNNNSTPKISTSKVSGTEVEAAVDTPPTFQMVFPAGKNRESVGGTRKVNPEGSADAFAFVDTVNDVQVIVTEQTLPDSFKEDPVNKLAEVAKGFQATDVIQVDDTKVYHGLSEKTGVQSLVSYKNGLLILIRSPQKLDDEVWASYIASFK